MSLSNDSIPPDEGPAIVRNLAALRDQCQAWRADGARIGFVPTMGALHEGHLSLVRLAAEKADRVVVSIFVNPSQFAAHEDLGAYPRTLEADRAALTGLGCDLIYAPSVEEIYPDGFSTHITVTGISEGLCGASRPHFFGGVATVVCKLFNQVKPDCAVFGEKDYQQLLVIRHMVRDLDLDVAIIGAPLIREADGLAMSSRNAYLSPEERRIAAGLNQQLAAAASTIIAGAKRGKATVNATLDATRQALFASGFDRIDYLELRDGEDLSPLPDNPTLDACAKARLFAAVIVGKTRLIDNWPLIP